MAATSAQQPPARRDLPDGYVAIPISVGQKASPVRISVVARSVPDPVGGSLVSLRQTAEARVYLGTLIDVGGRVHAWLELWVQELDAPGQTLAGWREPLSNAVLDQRWQRAAELAWGNDAAKVVRTGWESRHPVPVWLDVARGEPVTLADPSGETWKLCQDDTVLAAAGLPPYSGSLHRYLYLPKKGADGGFVPATPAAPANEQTRPAELPLAGRTDLTPFNSGGGLLMVCERVGLTLEAYLDLLAGAVSAKPNSSAQSGLSAPPILHGRTPIHLFGPAAGDDLASPEGRLANPGRDRGSEGWLLVGPGRVAGRLLESLYLRLRALADVASAVRAHAGRTRAPLLNVEPARFQVSLGEARGGLPAFWTARAVLVDPGDTIEVPVGSAATPYYLPARPLPASAYRRSPLGLAGEVAGEVRVERVSEEAGGAVVEGTLTPGDRLDAGLQDLLRLWLPLGGGRVRLHARLDPRTEPTSRERRFRSLPQSLAGDVVAQQLRAAAGATLAAATFEVLPRLDSDWDLYSVAAIGARALLVNASNHVGTALGELANLAAQAAADPAADDPLVSRVRRVVAAEPRYARSLGPHRLGWDGLSPERAAAAVPADLWWDVLAALMEALLHPIPCGPKLDGTTAADAPVGDPDHTFGPFLDRLDGLLIRTQRLFVPDSELDRELRGVIDGMLKAGDGPGPAP